MSVLHIKENFDHINIYYSGNMAQYFMFKKLMIQNRLKKK